MSVLRPSPSSSASRCQPLCERRAARAGWVHAGQPPTRPAHGRGGGGGYGRRLPGVCAIVAAGGGRATQP